MSEPSATSQATPKELAEAGLTLARIALVGLLKAIIGGALLLAIVFGILYALDRVRVATIFGQDVVIIRL